MKNLLQNTAEKWWKWAAGNPKKFFTWAMVFLSVSFAGSLIQGIFFPGDTVFKIKPPVMYSETSADEKTHINRDREMEKIVNELRTLKLKRDRKALQKEDSLRIEYLYNQYQELKNGY